MSINTDIVVGIGLLISSPVSWSSISSPIKLSIVSINLSNIAKSILLKPDDFLIANRLSLICVTLFKLSKSI